MALTLAQFDQARTDTTLLSQFRGSMTQLAGYVLNGDPGTTDPNLKRARLLWADQMLTRTTSEQFVVDSAARWLGYSVGTSGVFLSASSIVIADSDVQNMVGVIGSNLSVLQTLEATTVFP